MHDEQKTLIDTIANTAKRAGWTLADGRAEQIATAVAPRLQAFAPVRERLRFDDGRDFSAVLWDVREQPMPAVGGRTQRDTGGGHETVLSSQPHEWSLLQAAQALRAGKVSSEMLTRHVLSRATRLQSACNAFIEIDIDGALEAAREADRRRSSICRAARDSCDADGGLPSLLGVPVAYKDMFYRKGRVSSCGSAHRQHWVAPTTAHIVDRLRAAGVVELGTLNMTEFAYGPTGQNAHFGDTRNPWNPEYVTGGSSSGSAVAVSARIAFGAPGSDTAGSVRMPAALCGLVGMKTTHGLVSRYGCMPLSSALDTVGPLTRDVADNAAMLAWMCGADARDAASRNPGGGSDYPSYGAYLAAIGSGANAGAARSPLTGIRIGLPIGYFDRGLDASVAACLTNIAAALENLGATVLHVDMPDLDAVNAAGVILTWGDVLGLHGPMMRDAVAGYSTQTRGRIEVALGVTAQDVIDAHRYRGIALREFSQRVFDVCDVVLAPTFAMTTPRLSEVDVAGGPAMMHILDEFTRLTRPANVLGLPALALPVGFSDQGMPIGVQLIGRPFSEGRLYQVGHAYQHVSDWHTRVAPLAY